VRARQRAQFGWSFPSGQWFTGWAYSLLFGRGTAYPAHRQSRE
jgi:hypothetical protein